MVMITRIEDPNYELTVCGNPQPGMARLAAHHRQTTHRWPTRLARNRGDRSPVGFACWGIRAMIAVLPPGFAPPGRLRSVWGEDTRERFYEPPRGDQ